MKEMVRAKKTAHRPRSDGLCGRPFLPEDLIQWGDPRIYPVKGSHQIGGVVQQDRLACLIESD